MSERSEKQLSRAEKVVNTPQISRPALFDWIEDKFRGKDARPNFFYLRQAFGRSGSQYLPDIIFEKEFKPNQKEPERAEMVAIANKIFAVAQDHCRELGRPALYVVHAISHEKGAAPYGGHLMRLRPIAMNGDELLGGGAGGGGAGGDAGDDEVQSDAVNRQRLLDQSLEHQRANDEHARFMQDCFQKSMGSILAIQQEMIREARQENQTLKSQQLDWWKAIQAAEDKSLEREMQRTNNKIKAELLERGAGLVMQMIPVVAKQLDRNKNGGALPANGSAIEESAESISIRQFVAGLSDEQRAAILGTFDEAGTYTPGLFSAQQVKIFADVAELKQPAEALEALLPNGTFAISMEQITAAQAVVPMEQLMPLYAMISKSSHDKDEQ